MSDPAQSSAERRHSRKSAKGRARVAEERAVAGRRRSHRGSIARRRSCIVGRSCRIACGCGSCRCAVLSGMRLGGRAGMQSLHRGCGAAVLVRV